MTRRLSDVFGISHQSVVDAGAFDPFIDVDAPFYVDPFLLRTSQTYEMQGAEETFRRHFAQVILLLRSSQRRGDVLYKRATKLLEFPEVSGVHLGYSKGEFGSGIGPSLANSIAATAEEIVAAGIENPTIFEIVGLLEEGVGADRISDMTVRVILPHLLDFTERVARDLELTTISSGLRRSERQLPWVGGMRHPTILVPSDLLCHLPVAEDWCDIDHVCAENEDLRNRVNPIIGSTWREATERHTKSELREAILHYPDLLRDLLKQYEAKTAEAYDFEADPQGLLEWYKAREIVAEFPLDLLQFRTDTPDGVYGIAKRICERFGHLVEDQPRQPAVLR